MTTALPTDRMQGWAATEALKLYDAPKDGIKDKLKELRPAAMKNLLAVARAAQVLAEVEIFVRYQIGRGIIPADAGIALDAIRKQSVDPGGKEPNLPRYRALLGQIARLHAASTPRGRS